jgi:hypothetical protein
MCGVIKSLWLLQTFKKGLSTEEKNPENKKRINIITIFAVESNSLKTSSVSVYMV